MEHPTDIVITSRNRLDYLQMTLDYILARTHSPYALHIIDDNSGQDVTDYLLKLWRQGTIQTLLLRNERAGIMANKNVATWLTFSDPLVLCDDDVLCPDLAPDWLKCGLRVMAENASTGCLALNHPGAFRIPAGEPERGIVYCEVVGNTFMFIRRQVVTGWNLPHYRGNLGITDEIHRCAYAWQIGLKVGYLKDIYCYHIGKWSAATEKEYGNGPFVEPVNWATLEPPEEYK